MESSLHQQLKRIYADTRGATEVPIGPFRIDVVSDEQLVEIQHGSLSAIRDKTRQLLECHSLLIVKPIVARKRIVRRDRKGGRVVASRWSPKRGRAIDLFDELVYFGGLFPHPRLTLEVPLVEVEEIRYPGHGRRRRWRQSDFEIEDQQLIGIQRIHCLRTAGDLRRFVPDGLPDPFHTGHLARELDAPRAIAQRMAYCLKEAGTIQQVGKHRNARLYRFNVQRPTSNVQR